MPEFSTQELTDDINRSLGPGDFDAAATAALAKFDALNSVIIEQNQIQLACRKGCSICCTLRVDVFAHEVFLIARHILDHFTPGQIATLLDRLAVHTRTVVSMTPFEHVTNNLQCPLLEDGQCTIYQARPHSCRRHHSLDLAACQYTFDHPTDLETPAAHERDLYRTLTEAMHQNIEAYAEAGFDYTFYELGSALNEALNEPSNWRRWLNREQAFIYSSVTPMAE